MKYVYSPLTPIADRWETSHRAGWALYWAQELGATLITTSSQRRLESLVDKRDEVFVYHGMEFRDSMNFPGGPPLELVHRARLLSFLGEKLGSKLVSLDRIMPDYATLLGKVLSTKDFDADRMRKALKRADAMDAFQRRPEHVIIGDSHSLSMYEHLRTAIMRNDALTMHGAVKIGLMNLLNGVVWCNTGLGVKTLTIYFGNIDIRHHLCRHDMGDNATMVGEYLKQIKEIAKDFRGEIFLVSPLPIENESRVLPKTGWYKGTPFFGGWGDRASMRNWLHERLRKEAEKQSYGFIQHPKHFWNSDGELDFDVMEKPRSVHIRPAEYRLIHRHVKWSSVT